ncbi:YciI family protein [Rhodoligotrophos defluvii]|uniref:YciI family protein n=1 Tax=Rhodoligotrophos defluvii TaxID=2561934 RepID=UPI0010CA076C|nr:YciI family protein [Rhodoligotrophos defluvii]
MAHFVILCTDVPNSAEKRNGARPAHLQYLTSLGSKLRLAGPFMADDGKTMTGSMLVVETDTIEEARQIAAGDPYGPAGVFAEVEVKPWKWVITDGKLG